MGRAGAVGVLLALLAVGSASGQGDGLPDVRVERPRDFGYHVGDLLEWRASVRVPKGFALEARSLRGGPGPDWLEVREADWKVQETSDALLYRFRFVYQIFYAPVEVARLTVPDRTLLFRSEETGRGLRASIPGFSFTLSPLTDSTSAMEPDWPVPPPSGRWIEFSAGSLGVLLALWGASLAADRRRQRRRVFWRAHWDVRRAGDCAEAMLVLHRALEQRAGKTLFAHDLDALLERWPPAGRVRDDLERFFQLSDALFYGNHGVETSPDCLRWVQELSGRLMALERRLGDGEPAVGR